MTLEPISRKSAHVFTIQKIINYTLCTCEYETFIVLSYLYYTDYNKYTYVPCITHRKVTYSAMISATGLLTTLPANTATQVILYIPHFLIEVLKVS